MTTDELKRAPPKRHTGETVFVVGPESPPARVMRTVCARCYRAAWIEHRYGSGHAPGWTCAHCGAFRSAI